MNKQAKKLGRFGATLAIAFNLAACATPPANNNAPRNNRDTAPEVTTVQASYLQPAAYVTPAAGGDVLRFYNLHTEESITVTRNRGESISREANWFMRDFRRGEAANMDPQLFDLLGRLKTAIQRRHPGLDVEYQVVSPYRSPDTNEALRDAGGGQAEGSQHMQGKAIDIKVPGLSTIELRNIATCLNLGGVGYYPADGFVHVDTARVRYWPSRDYVSGLQCN
ncbi:MAG: DUF882 domain-containing protein [bacterium]|nr:DUF882 domain-containing protein [bacterium]